MKRFALVLLALALVGVAPTFAQANRGTITATVVGDDGAPLPGVTVDVSAPDTLTRRTVVTNEAGVASATGLDPSRSYAVVFSLEGFNTIEQTGVVVRAGQTSNLRAQLAMGVSETIQVTGEAPVVDVTNSITGQDITLELTESLPTGRSYQSYLQLVPGVLPDSTETPGNPASRSGVNYSDILGDVGTSTDNFYYIEGINVTDGTTGTFGANLNTEIIQEQSVLTGGLPAQYAGATGLISNVLTKSGGNQFSGSVNYYYQDDSLVADNEHREDSTFSTYDAAATLGGPLVRDKAWFFASFRKVERDEDVVSPSGEALRTVNVDNDQAFGKVTWSITPSTLFSGTFLTDPQDRSGSLDETLQGHDFRREQGGDRVTARLTQVASNWLLEAAYTDHEGDVSNFPVKPGERNTVAVLRPDTISQAEQQLGGYGRNLENTRGTESLSLSAEGAFDTSWGSHTLKLGYEQSENSAFQDDRFTERALYTSIDDRYLPGGISAGGYRAAGTIQEFRADNASDTNGLRNLGLAEHPEIAAALDTNHDGFVSNAEMQAGIIFNSTAGNPNGQINYQRDFQDRVGSTLLKSEGDVYYLQDVWQMGRWSVNAGLRVETWDHVASTGQRIYTFDEEYAPRLSVAYDLSGDGRQRLNAYYGRYYDPIRNNMTDFAGTLSGATLVEQVFVMGEWLTYRERGYTDAIFANTTETPYTDEWMLGYKTDLGQNMSFEVNLIKRETRDILEDYDLSLYALQSDGTTIYDDLCDNPGCRDDPNSLWLGLDYFGFTANPNTNFVIATLEGGERDWEGVELIFRKRYSNNWQMLTSYSYNDAAGNTNSDSNADFQGDVEWLDPRAPNQFGNQPGSIEHLFKIAGSYRWDSGFEVGGQYRWNSGTFLSRTWRASSRNLPCLVGGFVPCGDKEANLDLFAFAGITNIWIAPGTIGTLENDSWGSLDLRFAYEMAAGDWGNIDFFLDVFNALDDQATTRNQDLVAGLGDVDFGEGLEFVEPRRYFLGARLRF